MSLLNILNSNPYKPVTEKQKKQQFESEQEIKRNVIKFSEVAKDLFKDDRYEKLKNLYTETLKSTMRLIIYYENANPNEYNFKMREYQIQLRTLMNIFDTPQGFIDQAERILKGKK